MASGRCLAICQSGLQFQEAGRNVVAMTGSGCKAFFLILRCLQSSKTPADPGGGGSTHAINAQQS